MASYCERYGSKAIPPWKNTSRFGHTECIEEAPFSAIMRWRTVRNHDGTPEILVIFSLAAALTSAGSFLFQSSIRAISLSGTRTRFAKGLMHSIRFADKSPTFTPRGKPSNSLAKLPPRIKLFPANKRLCGLL